MVLSLSSSVVVKVFTSCNQLFPIAVFEVSYLILYELAGQDSPDNGNCKTEGETLLLSNSHQNCHRWVAVAAVAAVAVAVDSLVGSGLSSYRQTHLIYIEGKREVKLSHCNSYSS